MTHFENFFTGVDTSLPKTRRFVSQVLSEINWRDQEIDIQLAVGEVIQNTIRYGFQGGRDNGIITLVFDLEEGRLSCKIIDNALKANPSDWREKAAKRRPDEGGYGLTIISAIADDYQVIPKGDGNMVCLVFSKTERG